MRLTSYPLHDGHEIGVDEYGVTICLTCWRVQGFGGREPNVVKSWVHREWTPEKRVEHLCEVMHNAYEDAAAKAGWETQERSRKPWSEVPEANKVAMRAAVTALLKEIG